MFLRDYATREKKYVCCSLGEIFFDLTLKTNKCLRIIYSVISMLKIMPVKIFFKYTNGKYINICDVF